MNNDLVYRGDCLRALCDVCCSELKHYCNRDGDCGAGERIKNIPSANVTIIPDATWELTNIHFLWKCSNCGYLKENCKTNYCPECGAIMKSSC